jgi:membrane-bound metal-dependent hydrolase YbcI (DUF457 family)
MLLMCHLFVGLVIGLFLLHYVNDRWVVLLAGLGSILPDLIDKPLGHAILKGSIDFGRIYAHTGLFFLAIIAIGVAYRRINASWILLGLMAGVASHLVLDSMWEMPVTLFYPTMGDFSAHSFPNYFEDSIAKELGSFYEWIFGISSLGILLFTYSDRLGKSKDTVAKFTPRVLRIFALLLAVTGALALISAATGTYNPLSLEDNAEQNLIIGLAAIVGGLVSFRHWARTLSKVDCSG